MVTGTLNRPQHDIDNCSGYCASALAVGSYAAWGWGGGGKIQNVLTDSQKNQLKLRVASDGRVRPHQRHDERKNQAVGKS